MLENTEAEVLENTENRIDSNLFRVVTETMKETKLREESWRNKDFESLKYIENSIQEDISKDDLFRALTVAQKQGEKYFKLGRNTYNVEEFYMEKNFLKYNNRLFVPKSQVIKLLHKIHIVNFSTRHVGIAKTYQFVRQRYFWPTMSSDVEGFILACLACRKSKVFRGFKTWSSIITKVTEPFDQLGIDHFGFGAMSLPTDRGHKGVLTVVDAVSGYTRFIPVKTKSSKETLRVLKAYWFTYFGVPTQLRSDNARELLQSVMGSYFKENNVDNTSTGVDCSHQNGLAERPHRFLREQLVAFREDTGTMTGWSEEVSNIACRWNTTYSSKLKDTPHYFLFNKDFRVPNIEVDGKQRFKNWRENIKETLLKSIASDKANQRKGVFLIGELVVYVKKKVGQQKFDSNKGPLRIIESKAENVYVVRNILTQQVQQLAGEDLRLIYSSNGSA